MWAASRALADEPDKIDEDIVDGLQLGNAMSLFLDTKRVCGRSEKMVSEYRGKLNLLQRCDRPPFSAPVTMGVLARIAASLPPLSLQNA